MWYGLLVNGELYKVEYLPANLTPTLFDFDMPIDSFTDYQIVRVEIRILGPGI